MMGRCFSSTALPLRQQRRISDLVPHAGVISSPKASSTGLARKIGSREASPIHPGLVALPGSGAVLEFPGVTPWGVSSSLAGATGGRVVEHGSDATASFIHLFRRPAKNADQHIAKSFCSVAPSVFGSAHERNHEGVPGHEVVNCCQGFGNVCRA